MLLGAWQPQISFERQVEAQQWLEPSGAGPYAVETRVCLRSDASYVSTRQMRNRVNRVGN